MFFCPLSLILILFNILLKHYIALIMIFISDRNLIFWQSGCHVGDSSLTILYYSYLYVYYISSY